MDQHNQPHSPSTPFGRGWIPAERDIGLPGDEPGASGGAEFLPLGEGGPPQVVEGHGRVNANSPTPNPSRAREGDVPPPSFWTPRRKLAFLSALAEKGNVRLAAARAGVSHESAYRLRRRDALFAATWDAALVVARGHAEQVLADRAIDGIEEEVWFRGELVGTRRRYDGRLLLAHLARLDQMAERPFAETRAGRFDELLAQVGGLAFPPELGDVDVPRENYQADPLLPATRERHTRLALDEAEEEVALKRWQMEDPDAPDDWSQDPVEEVVPEPEPPEQIVARTQAEWNAWEAGVRALIDGPDGAGGDAGEDIAGMGPLEFKSLGGGVPPLWTVSTVSTRRARARAARPRRMQNGLDSTAHRV